MRKSNSLAKIDAICDTVQYMQRLCRDAADRYELATDEERECIADALKVAVQAEAEALDDRIADFARAGLA